MPAKRLAGGRCCRCGACLHLVKNPDPLTLLPPCPCPFAGYDIVSWRAKGSTGQSLWVRVPCAHACRLAHPRPHPSCPRRAPAANRISQLLRIPRHPLPGVYHHMCRASPAAWRPSRSSSRSVSAACSLPVGCSALLRHRCVIILTNFYHSQMPKLQSSRTSTTRGTGRALKQTPTRTGERGMLQWGAWAGLGGLVKLVWLQCCCACCYCNRLQANSLTMIPPSPACLLRPAARTTISE